MVAEITSRFTFADQTPNRHEHVVVRGSVCPFATDIRDVDASPNRNIHFIVILKTFESPLLYRILCGVAGQFDGIKLGH